MNTLNATPRPNGDRITIDRRAFIKSLGAGFAAFALCRPTVALAEGETEAESAWGVLIDLTRCTGCNSCALACKDVNHFSHDQDVPDHLDSDANSFVEICSTATDGREPGATSYVKRQCMHCLHPACASACTVGALRKTPEGPVVYDAEKCIGCRYCQYACPFGVPTYDWENPLGLIHKCDMCVNRLAVGEQPACVASCPNGALRFGKRSDLLAQAKAQIASNADRYVDHIYGEFEAGGTSMLYLSNVPFAELGFPTLGADEVPHNAEQVMRQTPTIALTVATLATGLHLLTKRKETIYLEAHAHDQTASTEPTGSTEPTTEEIQR